MNRAVTIEDMVAYVSWNDDKYHVPQQRAQWWTNRASVGGVGMENESTGTTAADTDSASKAYVSSSMHATAPASPGSAGTTDSSTGFSVDDSPSPSSPVEVSEEDLRMADEWMSELKSELSAQEALIVEPSVEAIAELLARIRRQERERWDTERKTLVGALVPVAMAEAVAEQSESFSTGGQVKVWRVTTKRARDLLKAIGELPWTPCQPSTTESGKSCATAGTASAPTGTSTSDPASPGSVSDSTGGSAPAWNSAQPCPVCHGSKMVRTGMIVGGLRLRVDDPDRAHEVMEPCQQCNRSETASGAPAGTGAKSVESTVDLSSAKKTSMSAEPCATTVATPSVQPSPSEPEAVKTMRDWMREGFPIRTLPCLDVYTTHLLAAYDAIAARLKEAEELIGRYRRHHMGMNIDCNMLGNTDLRCPICRDFDAWLGKGAK